MGGKGICPCFKQKYRCVKCGGKKPKLNLNYSRKCEDHNKNRYYCVECYKAATGGAGICPCLIQKRKCKKHGGSALCVCGKEKHRCVKCGGKQKTYPKCVCGIEKRRCKVCNAFVCFIQTTRSLVRHVRNHIKFGFKHKKTLEYVGMNSWKEWDEYFQAKIKVWNDTHPHMQISATNMAIDHIKPVKMFDDSAESRMQVHHYTNLQPLPRDVNAHKSSKWSEKDEEFWRANIIGNAQFREIYLPCLMQNSSTLNTNT